MMGIADKRAAAALCALISGCTRIQTTTTFTETLVDERSITHRLEKSRTYRVDSELDGQQLVLRLRYEEKCETTTTPVYERRAHHRREAASWWKPSTIFVGGLLVSAGGAYLYADADHLSATSMPPNETTPEEFRNSGMAGLAIGAALLGLAAIDAVRLRDSDELDNRYGGEPKTSEAVCASGPVRNAEVIGALAAAHWHVTATPSAEGAFRLDLHTLPATAFASLALPLTVSIDGETVDAPLALDSTARLRDLLAADASSQLAIDRAWEARERCARRVQEARAMQVDETSTSFIIASTEGTWRSAREQCGSAWTADDEKAEGEARARIASTSRPRLHRQCERAGTAAGATLQADSGDLTLADVTNTISEVEQACDGADNASQVTAQLHEAEAAARKRIAAREWALQSAEKVIQLLSIQDAVGLRSWLVKDPPMVQRLRATDDGVQVIRALADHWIAEVDERPPSGLVVQQICASRALVVMFSGASSWARLRAATVQQRGVVQGARLARILDGSCS